MMHTTARIAAPVAALLALWAPHAQAQAPDSARVQVSSLRPPPRSVSTSKLTNGVDSVTAPPGVSYKARMLHRFFFGSLNRNLWSIPLEAAVLRLDTLGGGAKVTELSGGKQTLGVRLMGKDSITYQFRSIVKDPTRSLPSIVRLTPFATLLHDQMAAQFPLAPIVVAEMLDAVDVLVARPQLVVMSDDPALGEFRSAFAGRMGWLEVRPEGRPGELPDWEGASKVVGTYDLYEELRSDGRNYVNTDALLKARFVDFLVGDWDRHSDQWRWARIAEGDRHRWDPIPRDRDWAMPSIDGPLASFVRIFTPAYVGFRKEYPDILSLAWSSQRVDRNLLSSVDRSTFMNAAAQVQSAFSDGVLQRIVSVLPESYEAAGERILNTLRFRRDSLQRIAAEFYALLAKEPTINGTMQSDSVTISSTDDGVRVQMHAPGSNALLLYDRTFTARETDELRIYLFDGRDNVVITGSEPLPIAVRISTGGDDDRVVDSTRGRNVYVYNSSGDDNTQLGSRAFYTERPYLTQDSSRTAGAMKFTERDWGSSTYVLPSAGIEPEIGLLLGARLVRNGYGFGQQECQSCFSLEGIVAPGAQEWIASTKYDRMLSAGGWWFANSAELYSGKPERFYGFGNDIPPNDNEAPFSGFRRTLEVRSGLRFEPAETWRIEGGPVYRRAGNIREGGDIFETSLYGMGFFEQAGVGGALEVDTRDSRALPRRGMVLRLSSDFYPELLDVREPYTISRGTLRVFQALPLPLDPAVHLRAVGAMAWGDGPFFDMPALGGSSTLPGFSRRQFRGDALASGSALLRAKAFSIGKMDVGLHGIAATGRVWAEDEDSSTWHRSTGGGLWIHLAGLDKTLSVTFASGNRSRTYFDFGFIW